MEETLQRIEAAGRKAGLRFEGVMMETIALFTDARHGSTFSVRIETGIRGLREQANETAARFGCEPLFT